MRPGRVVTIGLRGAGRGMEWSLSPAMPLSWFLWFTPVLIFAAVPPPVSAADTAGGPVVELPAFVITETRASERAWRYAEAEGFEIISQVSDDATQQVFAALWRGPRLTLPPALRPNQSTPTAVIIFDQEGDRAAGPSSLGSVKKDHEQTSHWTNVIKRTLPDREVFCVNLAGRYFTYSSTFRFDLRTLLAHRTPAAPPWLLEALYGAYGLYREGIDYPDRGKHAGVVSALWCNETELIRAEQLIGLANSYFDTVPEKRRGTIAMPPALRDAVVPPGALWEGGYPEDRRTPAEAARWAASCALFVRWGLYAEEGKRQDALWRFAAEAGGRVVDEAFFRACFGIGYDEARDEMAWYLPIALGEKATRPLAPLMPPPLALRPATTAEVARVRGDWERGEATLLQARFPELAAKYHAKAGRTLRTAYAAAPADARLAAVLGLFEFESGENARALELLTAATVGGEARPRAWFTLAHLRFLEINGRLGPRAKLPHADALPVLLPLEQAWRQEPAMAVTYELLAELWRRCPDLDGVQALARLQEGQKRFPRTTRLTLAALRAALERGDRAGGLALVEAGLPFVTDPALRERLEKTRQALANAPVTN